MNKLDLFPAFVELIVSWETLSDRKGNDLVLWGQRSHPEGSAI